MSETPTPHKRRRITKGLTTVSMPLDARIRLLLVTAKMRNADVHPSWNRLADGRRGDHWDRQADRLERVLRKQGIKLDPPANE